MGSLDGLNDADVVENARRGGIADHRFDVFRCNAVDDCLNREIARGRVDKVDIVPVLNRNTRRGREPLGIIKSSALRYCGAALFTGKSWVKGGVQEKNTH
jgi:hypothetical protein